MLALALAQKLGVLRGELVALISDNRPEWLVCSLAIHFLGAVDVPRASDTPPEILEAILRHAEPAVVIVEDPALLPWLREALPGLRRGRHHRRRLLRRIGRGSNRRRGLQSPLATRGRCTRWPSS